MQSGIFLSFLSTVPTPRPNDSQKIDVVNYYHSEYRLSPSKRKKMVTGDQFITISSHVYILTFYDVSKNVTYIADLLVVVKHVKNFAEI